MKIAFLMHYFKSPDSRGDYVRKIVLGLEKMGHNVTVFVTGPWYDSQALRTLPDYKVFSFPRILSKIPLLHEISLIPYLKKALRFLGQYDVFCVETHSFIDFLLVFLIKRLYNKPCVFDHHGLTFSVYKRGLDKLSLIKYDALFKFWLSFIQFNRIVTHSSYIRDEIKQRYHKNSEVVPHGVDLNRFNPNISGKHIRDHFNIGDATVILYVGRLEAHKGLQWLLKAIELIKKERKDVKIKIIIVGSGRERKSLEKITKRLNITDRVIFSGRVSVEELPSYYAASDIFVIPSLYEGFGLPILEAQACGSPVIGSDCTAIAETIGLGGVVFEPNNEVSLKNEILRLIDHKQTYNKFVEKSLENVEKYRWQNVIDRIEKILRNASNKDS
ncbi:MAG: glycosyltransferase family 4 protein [Promethearchaeota archaeon]